MAMVQTFLNPSRFAIPSISFPTWLIHPSLAYQKFETTTPHIATMVQEFACHMHATNIVMICLAKFLFPH